MKSPLSALTAAALVLVLVVGCGAPARPPGVVEPRPLREPFLIAPTTGFDAPLDVEKAHQIDRAHLSLMRGGSVSIALDAAAHWAGDPETVAPAAVLAAQADYLSGQCARVLTRLEPVVSERRGYVAAQLLYGRCAEQLGRLALAASSYHAVFSDHPIASARFDKVKMAARDDAEQRIRAALAAGDVDEARADLAQLQVWAPGDEETVGIIRQLAATLADDHLELRLLRDLVARGGADAELLERQAELELAVGDAGAGLGILEQLRREWPDDDRLARALEDARFDWRLTMLPDEARNLDSAPLLDRGQLALLVYWVFPTVRHQRPANAVIANDVFDHEHRSEIVRVVNLGLMDIDPNLHAFQPTEGATRVEALGTLLRVLAAAEPQHVCLEGTAVDEGLPVELVCGYAVRCGLLPESGDCLPSAPLSGSAAMELARRASLELEQG